MGCVERYGYPKCYGALYYSEQCCCPVTPRPRNALTQRVAELEEQLRELREDFKESKACDG